MNQINFKPNEDHEKNFSIAIMDIDDFKKINDTYGHQAGDVVLRQIVSLIKNLIFSRDIVCRYGGEEFAVIFTEGSKEGALRSAERIREEVEKYNFYISNEMREGHITVSIGFATFDEAYSDGICNVLRVADDRLYKAKATGKNKVVSI